MKIHGRISTVGMKSNPIMTMISEAVGSSRGNIPSLRDNGTRPGTRSTEALVKRTKRQ